MKIDVFAAENTYGTGVHFAKGIASALQSQGVTTRLFWVDEGQFFHAMHAIFDDPPDLTLSFADISLNRQPIGDLWKISHFTWMVDPPIYFLHQLQGDYSYVGCVDQQDIHFIEKLGFERAYFLPHAADKNHLTPVRKNRPLRAVFFGTCVDYEMIAEQWPPTIRGQLLEACERVLSPGHISIAQALAEQGISSQDFPFYHGEVDRYTRGKDRVMLIRSFKYPIHIWGEGPWQKYAPQHHVNPPISFDQALTIMKDAQIVINSAPRFKGGAHERIFYALLSGAAVYTGENSYLKTHLPDLFTYQFGEWDLPSFDNWQAIASAGQEKVLASHTWDSRAHDLLKILK
jgi:DUF based on E. rectale Gene description (DUF3880)